MSTTDAPADASGGSVAAVTAALVTALIGAGLSQRAALTTAGMARSTWHYRSHPRPAVAVPVAHTTRRAPSWLASCEQDTITAKLRDGFAVGWSVYCTFYEALDAGDPVASLSSWYRIARDRLAPERPVRRTRKHRATAIPQLLTDAPLQAWSWDITHLKGPYTKVTYQFYVVIDVFSRMITAWRIEDHEDDDLAREMFQDAFTAHGARPRIVHSDGGSAMTSNTLTGLFRDLGIEVSKNRPRVSNDNPFSESWFKTAKYAPTYPDYFTSIEQARGWADWFVDWYNHHHHHSALEGHTPADIHHDTWRAVHHQRVAAMNKLYTAHPERFTHPPVVKSPLASVGINHPITDERLQTG
ncbi:integrase-like protein [Antricoccus suffuscus]|uniref:Integrase-like protein n=1 Tax=Antricoccus suffuscus TaxID=1629062 RepID=A0A2T0YWZ7_9ACTN|nr:DDE-type integrase/transposase/recombinase [Antricoccus suffuscus]PRZ28616.1 integrase-like protein [Antricoccus suffuscus]